MKLKLYKNPYCSGVGLTDLYDLEVKVKKDAKYHPWEKVFSWEVEIGCFHGTNRWFISSWSPKIDKVMSKLFGDSFKAYDDKKSMMRDLKKLVEMFPPVYYIGLTEFTYEFA